jgi:hypothetical protein
MTSGGPAQTHKSPTTAAGKLPIKTVGTHGPVIGPPTCGLGVAKGHVCISVIRAADGIILFFYFQKKASPKPTFTISYRSFNNFVIPDSHSFSFTDAG